MMGKELQKLATGAEVQVLFDGEWVDAHFCAITEYDDGGVFRGVLGEMCCVEAVP